MHLKIQPKVILHNVVGPPAETRTAPPSDRRNAKIVRVSFLENRRPSGITDVRQGVRSVESSFSAEESSGWCCAKAEVESPPSLYPAPAVPAVDRQFQQGIRCENRFGEGICKSFIRKNEESPEALIFSVNQMLANRAGLMGRSRKESMTY